MSEGNAGMPASVDQSQAGVKTFIVERTKAHWEESRSPYLLSNISPELKARGVDYRAVLGEQKLKDFVHANAGLDFKVISHPAQRAKIGLIPAGEEYDFLTVETDAAEGPIEAPRKSVGGSRVGAMVSFLRALSHLTDEELDQIVIPTRVLVKLVARQ
jgi:hypothetical protein